jgi:hypothetical protein
MQGVVTVIWMDGETEDVRFKKSSDIEIGNGAIGIIDAVRDNQIIIPVVNVRHFVIKGVSE